MLVEIMAKGTTDGQRRLPEKKIHIDSEHIWATFDQTYRSRSHQTLSTVTNG